ncbi:MAG: ABC transporter ATP-binding protein [Candidatus Omnitrophota bacterium]|nr:ABC transporter ATP-binding protein [Candidatus Omnitrophota bacterium]
MDRVLELNGVTHSYGSQIIVENLSLQLERGDIGCLLGPSGDGKTTVLRAIAGFEEITAGEVLINGVCVSRPGWKMAPHKRRIGIVFQDHALFPHMTVAENVGFGLRASLKETQKVVASWLDAIGLRKAEKAFPHELSGGERQRVAIARAMAPKPDLILLDEPFSNLDIELREKLSMQVRDILKGHSATALFVTHDQQEAFAMGDGVGILHEKTVQQWGSAYDLYHRPANRFVADFIGEGIFLPAIVQSDTELTMELGSIRSAQKLSYPRGETVDMLLRPDDIVHDDESSMTAEVRKKTFRGSYILYTLRLASGCEVLSHVPSHHDHPIGCRIGIRLELDHVIAFKRIS